ncbi:MAG TPA: hypothetical protein VN616_04465 [Puia sp.]|nr:hypothetical protein [Puia sp.]
MVVYESILCLYKRLLSYRKTDWTAKDYPIRYKRSNVPDSNEGAREWTAQVIKWWIMFGSGGTKIAALDDLHATIERYRQANQVLPRPGVDAPIQFASTDQINQLQEIAVDFFPSILGYDFHGIFVSDESSVFDFGLDEQELLALVNGKYGLQMTSLGDGNIVSILKRIKTEKLPGGL